MTEFRHRSSVALLLSSALALAVSSTGCSKSSTPSETPAPSPTSAASAPAPQPSSSAPAAASAHGEVAGDPMATMFGTMQREAKERPKVHPNADDAFAAFAAAGVQVKDPQQSMARTYKAAYCTHGLTASTALAVMLCEYPDAASAAAGLDASNQVLKTLTTRHSYSHKTLLMATQLTNGEGDAPAVAAQKKVLAAFNAL